MNTKTKKLLFWTVVGLFMIFLLNLWNVPPPGGEEQVIFSDFMAQLERGDVVKVTIKGHQISGQL